MISGSCPCPFNLSPYNAAEITSIIKLISKWHESFLIDFFIITYAGQCVWLL